MYSLDLWLYFSIIFSRYYNCLVGFSGVGGRLSIKIISLLSRYTCIILNNIIWLITSEDCFKLSWSMSWSSIPIIKGTGASK